MQLSRSLGQYFTPPEVVDLAFGVLQWLEPNLTDGALVDLSCGEGAFLTGALRAGFTAHRLYGLDADPRLLSEWARYGLATEGRGVRLAITDGLAGGGEELFDVVVGNPPFGGASETADDTYLAASYDWWRLGQRSRANLPRELWFLERSLRLLRSGGVLAMVLPEGFLANKRWQAQREVLVRDCQVEAVVGLPRSVFRASRAAVKTVLLFVRKCPAVPGHRVRLAELEPDELAAVAERLTEEWQQGRSSGDERPWE